MTAAAGFGTIRIVKVSDLKIQANLSEKYINNVHLGDTVDVEIPVLNKSFKTTITAVSQVIDAKNRTFPIEIKLSKEIQSLKPNMLAILTINDYTNLQAFTVPINVIQNSGSELFLFTVQPENDSDILTVKKNIVKTGLNYDNIVEVIGGLKDNDQVISVGYQNLSDGQKVKTANDVKGTN